MSTSLLSAGEAQVAKAFIADMFAHGYKLAVYDGEEYALKASDSEADIIAAMGTTGEDHLFVIDPTKPKGERRVGWAFFVYGNAASEVINDHSGNLTPLLAKTLLAQTAREALGD